MFRIGVLDRLEGVGI